MEEKKFDFNSLIGFVLIGVILVWMLYQNAPTAEELEAEKAKKELVQKQDNTDTETGLTNAVTDTLIENNVVQVSDSLQLEVYKNQYGSFAYAQSLAKEGDEFTTVENDVLELIISNRGGYIHEARLKNF